MRNLSSGSATGNTLCALAWLASTVLIATLLLWTDAGTVFAHRPPIFVQGQGEQCECVLGVVFPTVIASGIDAQGNPVPGGPYGTGAWFKHWQNDPTGWLPFLDEDNLWVKTRCSPREGAENPVEPVEDLETAWGLDTTPSSAWWEGEQYDEWTEEIPDPHQREQQFYALFDVHCPCQILIKWLGTDGSTGSYFGACPKLWQWFTPGVVSGLAANVAAGEQVDITVRMICGDCILEVTDSATMAAAP